MCTLIQLRDNRSGHYRVQAEKINYFAKIEELSRFQTLSYGAIFTMVTPSSWLNRKPEEIRKINGLGPKSVSIIAKALESMGVIKNAEILLKE